jgi:hypothetical protein
MAAKKAPAKKMSAPKASVTDAQAKQMINKQITSMVSSGKGIRDYPKAQNVIDAIGDSFDPGGAFVTKIGRARFEKFADAEARKVHSRLAGAAGRGDMNRSSSMAGGYPTQKAAAKKSSSAKVMRVSKKK